MDADYKSDHESVISTKCNNDDNDSNCHEDKDMADNNHINDTNIPNGQGSFLKSVFTPLTHTYIHTCIRV